MGSSRHRGKSKDRDRDRGDRDRNRDRDRDRRERKRSRDRDRHRDRDHRGSGGGGGGGERDHRGGDNNNGSSSGGSRRDKERSRSRERKENRKEKTPPILTTTPTNFMTLPPPFTTTNVSIPATTTFSVATTPTTTTNIVTPLIAHIQQIQQQSSNQQDGEKLIADTLATLAATRNFASLVTQQREGDGNSNHSTGSQENDDGTKKRKRKSRWAGSEHDKIFIPGMPTILPTGLDKQQEEAYLLQLQIEEVSRKLRCGDLGIAANPEERSPSPEPIYSSDGKRLNTREFRTRRKLEEERHALVLKMQQINPEFKPPMDYKPPVIRVSDKVMIPQEEHPEINFVGLLIGPRGNTLKTMEKETGAKIIIRGKGSVKEGKVGRKDGQPLPGEDEPLHAYITATNPECVKKAVERIKEVIRQGVEVPENQNDLRRMQLRELAQLNGTLRENDGLRCNNCGATDHKSWLCPDKPNVTNNIVCSSCGAAGHIARDCRQKRPGQGGPPIPGDKAKIDEEYMSLMAELGEAPPPPDPSKTNENGTTTTMRKTTGFNMFEQQMAPRSIMPPPMPTPNNPGFMNGMAPPPPPPPGAWNMNWQPGPPGIMPPPPPPGETSPPQMMTWMGGAAAVNNQPPPPGATATTTTTPSGVAPMPPWQSAPFAWPPGTCPPPPPPGIDINTLLTAPPPPPPS